MSEFGKIEYQCNTPLCPANNDFSLEVVSSLEFGDIISLPDTLLENKKSDVGSFFYLTKYDAKIVSANKKKLIFKYNMKD
jgi:hypothetical protein